jgi:hypothetical protein
MRQHGWMLLVLLALAPGMALAGPEDGGCQGRRDCPRGDYSLLHYWWPELYETRAHFFRSNLDQYPPGPSPTVPPSYLYLRSRCPSIPATPSSPYADPENYYGRPIVPPQPAP